MSAVRKRSERAKISPPVLPPGKVDFDDVLEQLELHKRPYDADFLRSAFEFTREMHGDQTRRSGEPYYTHPLQVAHILAELRFDGNCVAVGLLHDVLEDTLTTRKALAEKFGEEIGELVEGVTKIGQHEYVRRDQAQAETFRKLLLASAVDIRVIIVKLADRLHNMMTLEHLTPEARRRIAQETLEIYAPTAQRLGMSKVQGDLEDLSFYHLYPHQFAELRSKIQEKVKHGRQATQKIRTELEKLLSEAEIDAEINFRVKRYYSIYRKLRRQGIDTSQLYDYLAFRIVTPSIKDCYAALGVVHQAWRPVPGRFKDYMAMPKPNLYQSLHTTLVGKSGQPFEVQIRTREMDLVAEEGIAAHWSYKEGRQGPAQTDQNLSWLRQLLEWQKEVQDPRTFLTTLKIDLYPDEVYSFTPKGEVLSFPRGATPLDFAYKIHTELGHHCVGARVNGKLVALRTHLQNGDIIEILTNPARNPSRDWLGIVGTSRAKNKIRQWLNTEQKKRAMEIGHRVVERELKKYKVTPKKIMDSPALADYLTSEGFSKIEDLYSSIGFGKTQVRYVVDRVLSEAQLATVEETPGAIRRAVTKILPFDTGAIRVKGQGDLLTYLAKCCSPLPGEEIVGYITRGRGVSVHSADCPNVKNLLYHPEREIEVEWERKSRELYPVVLSIETEDEPGMLARLTEAIARHHSNIRHIEAETEDSGRGLIEVMVEVRDRRHLEKLHESLQALPGVLHVDRRMASVSGADGNP
ncbi:MAG: bifunctional (p)ppGpp synthetase/guanosine-3',5'-bis(diphosphate) 3'-pyrophosphohydrolase [Thermoanaerobaculia bacterium]